MALLSPMLLPPPYRLFLDKLGINGEQDCARDAAKKRSFLRLLASFRQQPFYQFGYVFNCLIISICPVISRTTFIGHRVFPSICFGGFDFL